MSHNRNRPKTNSLTHLTKIIAEEVFEECREKYSLPIHFIAISDKVNELQDKYEKLDKKIIDCFLNSVNKLNEKMKKYFLNSDDTLQYLEEKIEKLSKNIPETKVTNLHIDTKEAIKKVNNDLLKSYELWSDDEHELLERELNVAITAMAANHQRSVGSIQSRIQKIAKKGKFFR